MGVIFFSGVKRKGNPGNLLTMVLLGFLSLSLLLPTVSTAEPFWGTKASSPADTSLAALQPGEFVWESQAEPSGPITVVVSLPEQRAYVYRNGIRIGVSTVSTGKEGYSTPTGVFTILNKDRHHRSKTYNNAAMPYSERLTWGGIALHAGGLPGYPSSHGCIHLPTVFAKDLFKITKTGMTVVIADEASAPRDVTHPGLLSPVDTQGNTVVGEQLSRWGKFTWHPEKSPQGPISILVSSTDKRALVFRNGVEISLSEVAIKNSGQPLGTHVYMAVAARGSEKNRSGISWKAIGLPGHGTQGTIVPDPLASSRIKLPRRFVKKINTLIKPGVTLMITDAPIHSDTTGSRLDVILGSHRG